MKMRERQRPKLRRMRRWALEMIQYIIGLNHRSARSGWAGIACPWRIWGRWRQPSRMIWAAVMDRILYPSYSLIISRHILSNLRCTIPITCHNTMAVNIIPIRIFQCLISIPINSLPPRSTIITIIIKIARISTTSRFSLTVDNP